MMNRSEVFPGGPTWTMLDAPITRLHSGEVFCFGTNEGGFHGAGSAGQAMRGDARNTWRTDPAFKAAMDAPVGDPARVGLWAVYGQAEGPMLGQAGKSYGIVTIVRPGQRRSTPLSDIGQSLTDLCRFANRRPGLTFLITPLGEGYSGYTRREMGEVWDHVSQHLGGLPANLKFVRVGEDSGASQT